MTIKSKLEEFEEKFTNKDIPTVNLNGDIYLWGKLEDAKNFLESSLKELSKQIRDDLMKVADEGEYEDLRREVERYFKDIK